MRHRRGQAPPAAAALIADGNGEYRGTYRCILDAGRPVLTVSDTDPDPGTVAEQPRANAGPMGTALSRPRCPGARQASVTQRRTMSRASTLRGGQVLSSTGRRPLLSRLRCLPPVS